MLKAEEIRDGLFSISWTVSFSHSWYSHAEETYNVEVDSSPFDNQLISASELPCNLTCKFINSRMAKRNRVNCIILEMRTAYPGHISERAVVTASFDSVKQEMTLNESIWKTSWTWTCDDLRGQANFEILIDLKPDCMFSTKKGAKNVLDHLARLWDDKTLSDVKFKCGQELIQAHTLILASGSPVLAAMFQNDFKEKQERVVLIKDVKAKIIRNLFRYIYVGECALLENGNQNAGELLKLLVAADKYAVQSLKEECESHLSRILSVENVSKCLVISHLHNCPELNRSVLKFMSENAKAVCTRKDWLKVIETYPKLCFQATQFMVGL